ncbi:MAG: heme ABC exporter ATP-binding protein CcmA [Candidatus Acidiferrales bacterium]
MAPDTAAESGPSGYAISFEKVEKRFGALAALRGVSLEVRAGEFVALLGPNGAGKTTLLRIAALLAAPTHGKVTFRSSQDGSEADQKDAKATVGMVGHGTLLYDELTAAENLTFYANLYSVPDVPARIASALEDCGLDTRAGSIVRTFSRGMRQRLAIAKALLHAPRILLLDEPAAGLDRQGLHWFSGRLEGLRASGATVLMSTHARNESLDLATRVVALAGGVLVQDSGSGGNPAPLLASLRAEA